VSTRLSRCVKNLAAPFSLLALAGSLAAQDSHSPPPYLQIFREVVKPGRNGPHIPLEAAWAHAFAKAKVPFYTFAMTTMYGPPEAWFLQANASIAEIEELNKAVDAAPGLADETDRLAQADAANISSFTGILTRYLPDLSNGPNIDVSQMRVWEVLVFQVRPGHEANFEEAAKLYKSTLGQAKIEAPWTTYGVMAGMPGPTYFVFVPHRTLAEIDPATGTGAAIEKAFNEEGMKKLSSLAEGYASVETLIFGVSPQMSNLSPDFVARDPKFWTPKPPAGKSRASAPKPTQ
jgi:hypothetical protein